MVVTRLLLQLHGAALDSRCRLSGAPRLLVCAFDYGVPAWSWSQTSFLRQASVAGVEMCRAYRQACVFRFKMY